MTAAKVSTATITAADLAGGAVTLGKIAAGAVTPPRWPPTRSAPARSWTSP